MRLATLAVIGGLCLSLSSCSTRGKQPTVINQTIPAISTSYSLYTKTIELPHAVAVTEGALQFKFLDVDSANNRCRLEIADTKGSDTQQGWVSVGSYADFAPRLVGNSGLKLEQLDGEKATVSLTWCESTRQ